MRYILIILLFLVFPTAIQAQEINLGLSPLKHHLIAKPGSSIKLPYTLTNYGDATLLTIQLVKLEVSDSLGNFTFVPISESDTPQPQVSLPEISDEPFLMLAKEEYASQIVIEIPEETKEQDYYFALLAQTQNSQGFETSSTVKLQGSVAAPLYISITKTGNTSQKISNPVVSIDTNHKLYFGNTPTVILDSNTPITGTITIENKDKNSTDVKTRMNITKSFALWPFQEFTQELPQITLLSNSRRVITLPQIPTLPPGKYLITVKTETMLGSKSTTNSFIVFPIRYTLYSFTLAFLAIGSFFVHKRYINT